MQEDKDYFILSEDSTIQGDCTSFISQKEREWRSIDKLEQYPYERVAVHTRNINYQSSNVRTFATLQKVLDYLIERIFPLMFENNSSHLQRERVALFLEERLLAIRCQYFVQGIICPKELLKLMRCLLVVWMMKGMSSGSSPLIGLQLLVQQESKKIMQEQFPIFYMQALKYSILTSSKAELGKLLSIHPIIMDDHYLYSILRMKLKIEKNNFYEFYRAIEHEQPIIRCLLWLQIQQFKLTFTSIVRKAFGDVPLQWLYRRLCLSDAGRGGWINLKQNKQIAEMMGIGFQAWIDLETVRSIVN